MRDVKDAGKGKEAAYEDRNSDRERANQCHVMTMN